MLLYNNKNVAIVFNMRNVKNELKLLSFMSLFKTRA